MRYVLAKETVQLIAQHINLSPENRLNLKRLFGLMIRAWEN